MTVGSFRPWGQRVHECSNQGILAQMLPVKCFKWQCSIGAMIVKVR